MTWRLDLSNLQKPIRQPRQRWKEGRCHNNWHVTELSFSLGIYEQQCFCLKLRSRKGPHKCAHLGEEMTWSLSWNWPAYCLSALALFPWFPGTIPPTIPAIFPGNQRIDMQHGAFLPRRLRWKQHTVHGRTVQSRQGDAPQGLSKVWLGGVTGPERFIKSDAFRYRDQHRSVSREPKFLASIWMIGLLPWEQLGKLFEVQVSRRCV